MAAYDALVIGGGHDGLVAAYQQLTARLGPDVLVSGTAAPGVELSLGLINDPALGPLIVVAAGGVLIELLADHAVVLPPWTSPGRTACSAGSAPLACWNGMRGAPPADRDAPAVAVAVDALVIAH